MSRDRSVAYRLGVALVAVACLAVAACSKSSDSSGSTDTTVATSGSGVTEETLSNSEVEQLATSALMTAAEVGPGFTEVPYEAQSTNAPAACGTPRADNVVPPQVQVGFEAESSNGQLAFQEEIRYFGDPAQARESFEVGSTGLNCTQGEIVGSNGQATPVTISPPTDLSAEFPQVDAVTVWTVSSAIFESQVVAVLMGQLVVTLQFGNVIGADISGAPNPLTVATAAIQKVIDS